MSKEQTPIAALYEWIKNWWLYNVKRSYWVIYTPSYYCSANEWNDWFPLEMYLDENGSWTENMQEAKRFYNEQSTLNLYTRSKQIKP